MDNRQVTLITFYAIVGVVVLGLATIFAIVGSTEEAVSFFHSKEIAPVSCQCSCVKE